MGKSGKPLTQNGLARMLKPLKITTENIRVGDEVLKGYVLKHFEEAFARYLPPEGELLHRYKCDEKGISKPFQTAAPNPDVAEQKSRKSANDGACSIVAVARGGNGAKTCVQCNETPDGAETLCHVDDVEVWLHPECEPFYRGSGKFASPPVRRIAAGRPNQ
jgi:hypothetical protein